MLSANCRHVIAHFTSRHLSNGSIQHSLSLIYDHVFSRTTLRAVRLGGVQGELWNGTKVNMQWHISEKYNG